MLQRKIGFENLPRDPIIMDDLKLIYSLRSYVSDLKGNKHIPQRTWDAIDRFEARLSTRSSLWMTKEERKGCQVLIDYFNDVKRFDKIKSAVAVDFADHHTVATAKGKKIPK